VRAQVFHRTASPFTVKATLGTHPRILTLLSGSSSQNGQRCLAPHLCFRTGNCCPIPNSTTLVGPSPYWISFDRLLATLIRAHADHPHYRPPLSLITARSVNRGTLTVSLHHYRVSFTSNEISVRNCQPWDLLHSGSWRFTPAESLARSLPKDPSLFTAVSTRSVTPPNSNHLLDAIEKESNFLDLYCFYLCHCTPIRSLT
jgi:hypothetical protein